MGEPVTGLEAGPGSEIRVYARDAAADTSDGDRLDLRDRPIIEPQSQQLCGPLQLRRKSLPRFQRPRPFPDRATREGALGGDLCTIEAPRVLNTSAR